MDWRKMLGDKLISAEEAVRPVQSGERVATTPLTSTPTTLCSALMNRKGELKQVRIENLAPLFNWFQEGAEEAFEVINVYAGPVDRAFTRAGRGEYVPLARFRAYEVPEGLTEEPDHFFLPVSPPDRHGFCSLGIGAWFSRTYAARSKRVVAEVHENFIRTGGENYLHVSEIDAFVKAAAPIPAPPPVQLPEHEATAVEVICSLVAAELINDRDTV